VEYCCSRFWVWKKRAEIESVSIRAGTAVRKFKPVKSDGPNDLIFQSVKDGKPMRDNNILTRFIKPAARKIGLAFVNWRCLRISYGTWHQKKGGHEGHPRADATLADFHDDGYLRSGHS
jgi:hypothetical protein